MSSKAWDAFAASLIESGKVPRCESNIARTEHHYDRFYCDKVRGHEGKHHASHRTAVNGGMNVYADIEWIIEGE